MGSLAVADFARIFRCAPGTVHYWISKDKIQGRQVGRHKVYPIEAVQAAYDRRHPCLSEA
jgi:hypothetical protein